MIRHIVLFSFEKDLDSPEVKELHRRFCALPGLIEDIVSFESGTDNSPEGKSHGFTMAYTLEFADIPARDRYLVHPRHREFSSYAGPLLKDVLVFDYVEDVIPTGT